MPTRAELEDALRNADAAGDADAARQLADALHAMPADAPAQPSAKSKSQPKAKKPGVGDALQKLPMVQEAVGAAHGLGQFGLGLTQLAVSQNPASQAIKLDQFLRDKLSPKTTQDLIRERPKTTASKVTATMEDMIGNASKDMRAKFDKSGAGQSLPGKVSSFAGEYAPAFAMPGGGARQVGVKLLSKAGAIALAKDVAVNAAQGAAFSNAQVVEPGQSRAERTIEGGALGGAFGFGGRMVGEGAKLTGKVISAATAPLRSLTKKNIAQRARQLLNDAAENPNAIFRQSESAVPGVQRTLAEQSLDPGIAQLQRQFPKQLQGIADQNNDKQVQYLRDQFGGASTAAADAKRTAVMTAELPGLSEAKKQVGAETARVLTWIDRAKNSVSFRGDTNVSGFLDQVRGRIAVPIDDAGRLSAARGIVKDAIENTPRMSSADRNLLKEARRLIISAHNAGGLADDVAKQIAKIKPTSLNAQNILGDMRRAMRTAERGKDDVASLYNTRKAITAEMMPKAIKNGDGASIKALHGAIQQLDRQIEAVAPTYKSYLKGYASGMQKADQIVSGANVLKRGTSAGVNERIIQPGRFLSATDDLRGILPKRAQAWNVKPEKLFTPEQIASIDNVRDDLVRVQSANKIGKAVGSDTVQNGKTSDLIADAVGKGILREMLSTIPSGIGKMSEKLGKMTDERVNVLVVEMLKDPVRARTVMAMMPKAQRSIIQAKLSALSRPMAAGAAGVSVDQMNQVESR